MSLSPTVPEPAPLPRPQDLGQIPPPVSVPDPQGACRRELLAALQRQDDLAIARLSARWAHRHGVESLQGLIRQQEGAAASAADRAAASSPPGLPDPEPLASSTGGNAGTSRFNPIRRLRSLVRDCIDEVASTFQDGEEALATDQQRPKPRPLTIAEPADPAPRPSAAPVPLDLADLRSWLPDREDHQHRRAS